MSILSYEGISIVAAKESNAAAIACRLSETRRAINAPLKRTVQPDRLSALPRR